jgi:hypothetical protein
MGFTKRFINKELILSTRKNGERITGLFNCESVICTDKFSYEILNLITKGTSEDDLKTYVLSNIHIE